tara:strand:+ start:291 stop:482 length:192 start_codon:yes stop_codon:yes gene_type:complete
MSIEERELRSSWKEYEKAGHPRTFNYARMFFAYNIFFNKRENNPLCGSCIHRVVKNIKLWLKS